MLSLEQIEELRKFDTPTVSNAIERFNVRSKIEGFMSPEVKCILSYDKPVVGYACTVKVSAQEPPTEKQKNLTEGYYHMLKKGDYPKFIVVEDLDSSSVGSFWGEVNASIHKSLGCIGTITNGGVRDLDEVSELGFSYFANCVLVSHGYIHLVEYDCTVQVGGITVQPGDLLHGDKHGVVVIPAEIADQVADACRKAQCSEIPIIGGCKNKNYKDVLVEELIEWRKEMERRREA